jgi:hypothetical protein
MDSAKNGQKLHGCNLQMVIGIKLLSSFLVDLCHMIIVRETLVSEELFEEYFVCDLNACKGACCVEGESGAPLENEELNEFEAVYELVKPYMRPEGIEAIEKKGFYTVDHDGDLVTTLVGDQGECSFVCIRRTWNCKMRTRTGISRW